MAKDSPRIGGRIQRLRRDKTMSQAQLAQLLDISPSYLNLIEHNRRGITVALLLKISQQLGVAAGELVESGESRLAGDLMELFGDDMFTEFSLTNLDIRDVAASNAKFGQAVVRLFDRYRALRKDRGHAKDEVADEADEEVATDVVSDFLQVNQNHFPALELAAERVRHDMDLSSDSFEYGLKTYLYNVFGLRWRTGALPDGVTRRIDSMRDEMMTGDVLPTETAVFLAAQHLGTLAAAAEIAEILRRSELPEHALGLARDALAAYFAAAVIMPYEGFYRACVESRYDVERVGRLFKASFEQVCHRMTTLQRPGRSGVPMHMVRTDIAGNISKRFSLSGIRIPRHSGACPRWNVYGAFLHPEKIHVQVSQMPEGQRYLCIAKSFVKGGYRHNMPRRHMAVGLGCHIGHAAALVYSDGIDVRSAEQTVPIGGGCRVCPRLDCGQRAYPPLPSLLKGAG